MSELKSFKVIGGGHSEGGKSYPPGSTLQSPHDLDVMFGNKFERVAGPAVITASQIGLTTAGEVERRGPRPVKRVEAPPEPESELETLEEEEDPRGTDVTSDYVGVKELDLTVFAVTVGKNRRFNIHDGTSKTPSNDKPLTAAKLAIKLTELGVTDTEE